MKPEIFINFKHYENAVGYSVEKLLNDFGGVGNQDTLYYCLSPLDLRLQQKFPDLKILGQHVDPNGYGAYTGSVSIDSMKDIGIKGSLLNHSEKRLPEEIIENTVKRAKDMDFKIILCVESIDEVEKYSVLEPEYIAYEPPELIGGNISVSSSKPDIIEKAAKICDGKTGLLVGAGIKSREDIEISTDLGSAGVLIASGIIRNAKPINMLLSLMGNR